MKKIDLKIIIIIILIIVLSIMLFFYFKTDTNNNIRTNNQFQLINTDNSETTNDNSITNINVSAEVVSGLTENIQLHSTYYLEESYIQEKQELEEGENILKYSNGTYLTAPYKCVINEINIPQEGEKCTNSNYIQISSINNLAIEFKVDESDISNISIGQEAKIKISAIENEKNYEGNIVSISNTASNGKFTVRVEFQNDGKIKLGMSANIEI